MQESTFRLATPYGGDIFVYRWLPASPPIAVVQIIHGLAEHAGRYRRVAEVLTGKGYAVYGSDLRGHGRTAPDPKELGFFGERDGWRECLDDLWRLQQRIAAEHPAAPLFLLGHSMGSTLARQFVAQHGDALAGVILSGSSGQPTPLAVCGRLIARIERLRLGRRGTSALIRALTFESFNKPFRPARTKFDWLSRDPDEVDRYIADPLCGFNASLQLWIDMLDAWCGIGNSCAGVPRTLPIYVMSGSHDPVSAGTKMLQPMLAQYRAAGLQVEHKFYPEARHELLNEINRQEVIDDLLEWIGQTLSKVQASQPFAQR